MVSQMYEVLGDAPIVGDSDEDDMVAGGSCGADVGLRCFISPAAVSSECRGELRVAQNDGGTEIACFDLTRLYPPKKEKLGRRATVAPGSELRAVNCPALRYIY